MIDLTQERVLQLLRYDPETGVWTWLAHASRAPRWNGRFAGTVAGTINHAGYRHIMVDGKKYHSARLATFYMTGEWPVKTVDHENLNKSDDHWDNLRAANPFQQQYNQALRRVNKTGYKWVFWEKARRKYRVEIRFNGKVHRVGRFDDPEVAYAAACTVAKELHEEFVRLS